LVGEAGQIVGGSRGGGGVGDVGGDVAAQAWAVFEEAVDMRSPGAVGGLAANQKRAGAGDGGINLCGQIIPGRWGARG